MNQFLGEFQMSASVQLHHKLFYHANSMPQKIGLMLDMQLLSFAEVMHCVQTVAVHLVKGAPSVQPDEVVYQMVQRSLELPIGYFGILTAGGLYCALDPMESTNRIDQLIDQAGRTRSVILHKATARQTYVALTECSLHENEFC